MAEHMEILDFGLAPDDKSKNIIKVIGVGGAGGNAVKNMYQEGIVNVTFAVCNTDSQVLSNSPVPVKILLGKSGLGAGGKPEFGRKEAETNVEDIKKLLSDGTKMVFVTAGMGGGTGTGAAPLIAGIAKSMGILTIGIVTIPFFFEKRNKIITALRGLEEMRRNVDAILIINNERLCDVTSNSRVTLKEAFKRADNILCDATKSISELITVEGTINLDFRDVESTMRGGGGAIMAMGRAKGDHRVQNAILDALDSPLLYGSDISKAKKILFNIYTSEESPLYVDELQEIDAFMDELDPNIDVIWGESDDNTLGEDAKVTILATGLDQEDVMPDHASDEAEYDQMIQKLYRSSRPKPKHVEEQEAETSFKPEPDTENTSVDSETPEPVAVEVSSEQEDDEESISKPIELDPEPRKPVGPAHHKPTFADRVRQRFKEMADKLMAPEE